MLLNDSGRQIRPPSDDPDDQKRFEDELYRIYVNRDTNVRIIHLASEGIDYVMSTALLLSQLFQWFNSTAAIAVINMIAISTSIGTIIYEIVIDSRIIRGLRYMPYGWLEYIRLALRLSQFILSAIVVFHALGYTNNQTFVNYIVTANALVSQLISLPQLIRNAVAVDRRDMKISSVSLF